MELPLKEVFGELGISQYLQTFVEQGFDSWDTILDITESDLDALGVKLGHRRKLQRRIANSRGIAPDVALGSPASTRISIEERFEPPRPEGIKPGEVKDAGVTKRKYRRHPKADENAPERPPSAYVLFSNKMREDLKGRNLTFTEIAKLVGENWQSLTPAEKEPYESQAQQAKERYNNQLSEYKKTSEYRQYNQYLQEFKLKHSSCHPQDKDSLKRPRLEGNLQAVLHTGVTTSSTTLGGSSRGNTSGITSGESHQGSEPTPQSCSNSTAVSDPSSVSTTPLSFHRNIDDSLVSPGGFFEPMDPSPKPCTQDAPHRDHHSRKPTSWRPSESRPCHLPSLSDVFDPTKQPFSQAPEKTVYSGFMQTHYRSGPGPPNQAQPDLRPSLMDISLKKNSSNGSMSSGSGSGSISGTTSGSGLTSGSSGQGHPTSCLPLPPTSSETSLPLPIHALLGSKMSSRLGSPGGTRSPSSQQSSSNEHPTYPSPQAQSRATSTIPSGSLDFLSVGNGFQSPPEICAHQESPFQREGRAAAETLHQSANSSKEDSNGLDGMSALLRAGEIVDRRT